jgi:hypothetical protein
MSSTLVWETVLSYKPEGESQRQRFALGDYIEPLGPDKQKIFAGDGETAEASALTNLNALHIEATANYLRQKSSLLHRVAVQLSQHLVSTYQEKLASSEPSGKKQSEDLPYFQTTSEAVSKLGDIGWLA